MGEQLRRYNKRKEAIAKLRDSDGKSSTTLIIHYSCESFYDRTDGSTPRITSIAVRNLSSGQTDSFSIHKIAELKHILSADISGQYDILEKEMLFELFEYMHKHIGFNWVHWNMRDINYGFQALEHRFKVLGGNPGISLPEQNKLDLARALVTIYGSGYIEHPRFESIMSYNNISDLDFLNGKQEASAFENAEYVKLHQSTLRKVDILADLFERTLQGTLKTKSRWYESSGMHPKILLELATENWILTLIVVAITLFGFFADLTSIHDRFSDKPQPNPKADPLTDTLLFIEER